MLFLNAMSIMVGFFLSKDVVSLNMPPNDVTPNGSRAKMSLANAAAEAGCLHPSLSHGNMSTESLVSDDAIDNATSMVRIMLLNQTVQQIILETKSETVLKFEYQFTCTDTTKNYVLKVLVPRSRTLHMDGNEYKIHIHCKDRCAKLHSNAKGLNSYAFLNSTEITLTRHDQSVLIQNGNINVTLIGGLIGISHINFSVYTVDHINKTNNKVRVLGLYKLRKSPYKNKASPFLYEMDPAEPSEELTLLESTSVDVLVVRTPNIIDTVFIALVFVMEIVQMIALGSLVELEDFKKIFRRPVGIVTGLLCHYVIMTLVS